MIRLLKRIVVSSMSELEELKTTTSSSFNEEFYVLSIPRQILKITIIITFILGLVADVGIIYTICHSKKLKTVPNILILNWTLCDSLNLVVIFCNYHLSWRIDTPIPLLSFLYNIEHVLRCTIFSFVTLLNIDWCLGAYYKKCSKFFRKHYSITIAYVWGGALLAICIYLGLIAHEIYLDVTIWLILVLFLLNILLVVVLQASRAVQKCRKKPLNYSTLPLRLTTAFTILFLIIFVGMASMDPARIYIYVFEYVINVISVFVFIILYCSDPEFQKTVLHAIKCTKIFFCSASRKTNIDGTDKPVEVISVK